MLLIMLEFLGKTKMFYVAWCQIFNLLFVVTRWDNGLENNLKVKQLNSAKINFNRKPKIFKENLKAKLS